MIFRSLLAAFLVACAVTPRASNQNPENLARSAHASASESQSPELSPEKAIDGDEGTRWSGIPGHNSGVWFELDWDQPVKIATVVVEQYDRFSEEWDLQTWDDAAHDWVTRQHFGTKGERLPKNVLARITPTTTTKLRIANVTNGPSFNEVEVYADSKAFPPIFEVASDLQGNYIGILTDAFGGGPMSHQQLSLSGRTLKGSWKEEAETDEHGLFTAPMHLGELGPVTVKGGGAQKMLDSAAFQYGLTPISKDAKREELDGTWRFSVDPPDGFWRPGFDDAKWSPISVPGHWEMEGFRSIDGIGVYRRTFTVPKGTGRLKLRFDGVYSGAEVWVNGKRMAYHEGGFTPFEIDVTSVVHAGQNTLALRVTEHTNTSDNLDKMSLYADFPLSGIIRKVYLFRVPETHIARYAAATTFEGGKATVACDVFAIDELGGSSASLRAQRSSVHEALGQHTASVAGISVVTHSIANRAPTNPDYLRSPSKAGSRKLGVPATGLVPVCSSGAEPRGEVAYLLTAQLKLPDGKIAAQSIQPIEIPTDGSTQGKAHLQLEVPNPRPWTAETPNLYMLSLQLERNGHVVQTLDQNFGLRQTSIDGSKLLIDGKPVKIHGTCHHDSDPLLGRAVTVARTRQDLNLIKEDNLNAVRTSHYPPIPELIDIADELGLYVEDEADFCWVGVSDDLRNTPRILQLTAELLARDRNHPSVFMWSLCNESGFGYGFERSHEWVRKTDPSRPTGAATSAWLEIATLHNPITLGRIKENQDIGKPLLFDEAWCIYQGIFGDVNEMWVDPGVRDYYVEPLPAIYRAMMDDQTTQGSQIWCWQDDIFCVPGRGLEYGRGTTQSHFIEGEYEMPGRGLVGDAPWGVVDGWRRQKPEYWITKKLNSPVKIAEGPIHVSGGQVKIPVENQYDFLNLSELKATYTVGNEKGDCHLNVPPHSHGDLTISLRTKHAEGETFEIKFESQDGRLIDAYRLRLQERTLADATTDSEQSARSPGAETASSGSSHVAPEETSGSPQDPPSFPWWEGSVSEANRGRGLREPTSPEYSCTPSNPGSRRGSSGTKDREAPLPSLERSEDPLFSPSSRPPSPHPAQSQAPPLAIRESDTLSGNGLEILGRDFDLVFDRDSGYLRRCVVRNSPTLLEFPMLHILPTESPSSPIPTRTQWSSRGFSWERKGEDVVVKLNGVYPDFEGSYEITITPAGEITVRSSFKYSGPNRLAREIGISFSVPKPCDTLHWERNAEWSVYPPDHIGRPIGTTPAFAKHPQTVPPTWPWSQDNSPMGSNDFRSTKRNIYNAWIAYPTGAGVSILSNGKQSLRAMVDTDRIDVNVSDWYGGTNVGWNEWISNYGSGRLIRTGDVLESSLRLRLGEVGRS